MVLRSEGYAVGVDGSPVFYRIHDDGCGADAPTVMLCDGIGCDGYVWKYLIPALAREARVIHWHYRGHGRTPEPRDRRRITIPDLADDLAAVLDAASVDSAVLVGHSMGVQVCLEGFRRHGDRVSGLVLMCGSYGNPLRTFKGRRTLESVLPWVSFAVGRVPGVTAALLRLAMPTRLSYAMATRLEVNGDLLRMEDFMPYLEHLGAMDPTLFLAMLAQAGRHSAREVLEHIDVPTLIVGGERDGFTPPELSLEMHRAIAGSELLVVDAGSHTAPLERPELVDDEVLRFLRARIFAAAPRTAAARLG